ncbi:hypothetical protein QBC98_006100 [Kitasatospora acidiphila]
MEHGRKSVDVGISEFGIEMLDLIRGQGLPDLPDRPQGMRFAKTARRPGQSREGVLMIGSSSVRPSSQCCHTRNGIDAGRLRQ